MGAVIFISASLGGCLQPPAKEDVPMATTPEQARSAPTQPALRQSEPEAAKPAKKATTTVKEPEQPAPVLPPEPTIYRAAELVGKSQSEVTALIGTPLRVEQRAASTVWTYRKDECGLDVFFFLDMSTSDERVLTVESKMDLAASNSASTDAAATNAAATDAVATDATATDAITGGAAGAETTASDAAPGEIPADADGDSVADACYGKLRRS
jgi:hypothetical protein